MVISGSDALVEGKAWTRFWLLGVIPVANSRTNPDMVRSAEFRAAVEGLWVPASLLPQSGVRWEQIDADAARLSIERTNPPILLELTLAPDGAVRKISGQRWSNANADRIFRAQPFGGTVQGEAIFEGFTIPAALQVGNHYGTLDYLPFFQAPITRAKYLPWSLRNSHGRGTVAVSRAGRIKWSEPYPSRVTSRRATPSNALPC
jgi:hypothetical protein